MAVKIRLARRGRKKLAIYDIVVADARSPRDGKFIEKIGQYNPNSNPATISIKDERALYWVMVGAQPTETAKRILSYKGILLKKHLQVGVNKGAISQEIADARFQDWNASKETKITGKSDSVTAAKEAAKKAALEVERKKNADRAAAQAAANAPAPVEEATPVAEETPAVEEAPVVEETATEAPVAEAAAETKAEA